MHKHTTACIKPGLNELVTIFEMLQQVLVVDIVHFYDLVLVVLE